ncbi:1,2-dihydroxy-3-keto-5-methylthiopentene dioxygenase [Azospirillum rugosum]|uniref:Acireductone dioxygenase n=1 Tax=Azospirillum rugosum TaxID=416170 RepID=A0ABS4SEF8_9PROT|nr:cupin domain-containing protein [Azospirillum rugosum]MBP2290971.1 1,2-dihydroxy-3-keto-5-methylthiopentene dioxygenase [Azospirillum rugosum]MDQ0524965.1 1,2-dihydroxy-3-keto-5-methylthiopentene dioxygenase [Azospirillum rugosum]
MAWLTVYPDNDPTVVELSSSDRMVVSGHLAMAGLLFERWNAEKAIDDTADTAAVLAAYAGPIAALKRARGFQSADVVRVPRGMPEAGALRAKFLAEHTHEEDEARFFVEGSGAFYLHVGDRVLRVVCERGDLLSVPAGTKHWFDMGPDPHFTAIRFFTRPDGWVAAFTGDVIADHFPRYDGPR